MIGVIHLPPLPSSPRYEGQDVEEIYDRAIRDARVLGENSVDGLNLENASDLPFSRPDEIGPETVAITADRSIGEQARDAEFFDADVLLVSGTRTGAPTKVDDIEAVRSGTSLPVLIGSGLTAESAPELLLALTARSSAAGSRRMVSGGARSTAGGSER